MFNWFRRKKKRVTHEWYGSMKLISWATAKWEMKDWIMIWNWILEYPDGQIKEWPMQNWRPNGIRTIRDRSWNKSKWNVVNWKLSGIWNSSFSDWFSESANMSWHRAWIDNTLL